MLSTKDFSSFFQWAFGYSKLDISLNPVHLLFIIVYLDPSDVLLQLALIDNRLVFEIFLLFLFDKIVFVQFIFNFFDIVLVCLEFGSVCIAPCS